MTDEKILKDEILKEEQLDNVAGGSNFETDNDIKRFQKLGFISKNTTTPLQDLYDAFQRFGIVANKNDIRANEYFNINNDRKFKTREDAWDYIYEKLGR